MKFTRFLVTAISFFLVAAAPAHAEPITIAIFGSAFAATAAGSVVSALFSLAVGFAASLVQKMLIGQPKQKAVGVKQDVEFGDDLPVSTTIGYAATTGKRKYIGTWGDEGKVPNAYLVDVIELGSLPFRGATINNITLHVDDKKVTILTGAGDMHPEKGYPIKDFQSGDAIPTTYGWVKFKNGTQTVADTYLTDRFKPVGPDADEDEKAADRPWTDKMIGRGIPHIIMTYRFKTKFFNSFPKVVIETPILPLYNIAKDSTNGGNGTHRWNDQTTWEPSVNNAVIIYNIARGLSYEGQWFFGGQNLAPARLPASSWIAAVQECDRDIVIPGTKTEKQFRAGYELSGDEEPLDVIEEIRAGCAGRIAEVGGSFKMMVGAPGAAVYSFTDDDIIITESQSFDPFPGLQSTYNGIEATYPEPAQKWASKDAPSIYDADLAIADGNRRLPIGVKFTAVPFARQVQRLMRAMLKEERRFRTHEFCLPPDAWPLEPNDVVSWTSKRQGYINKRFIVLEIEGRMTMNQVVRIKELDPTDYDWSPSFEQPFNNLLSGPIIVPIQPMPQWNAEPDFIADATGAQRRPAIKVSCIADMEDVSNIWVRVRVKATGRVVLDTRDLPYENPWYWRLSGDWCLPNETYEVQACVVPITNREVSFSTWITVKVGNIQFQSTDILDGAIIAGKIANAAVSANAIMDAAVTGLKLADQAVSTNKLAVAAVTAQVLADGAVIAAKLADAAVSVSKIMDGAVIAAKIADAAIERDKLAAQAVDATKFASGIAPVGVISGTVVPTTKTQDVITVNGKLYRWNGSAYTASVPTVDLTGTIVGTQISDAAITAAKLADAAVTAAKFATGLRPVEVVSALPTTGNTAGRMAYLTTDGKLYRYSGTAWVSTVDATDINGTIAEANIASLAASKITGQLTDSQIAQVAAAKVAGQLAGSQIADLAITNTKLAALAVDAAKLADGSVIAAKLADAAVTTNKFAAGLRPIEVVSTLPTTGNTEGRIVFLTTDDKLYRFNGTAFVSTLAAGDITGTLLDAQIAAVAAGKVTGQMTDSQIAAVGAAKLTGTLVSSQIADAAITAAKFASGLRPVESVTSLPTSGNVAGRVVFLTTDGKLYRYDGTSWISTVPAADIAGTIADTQIAAIAAGKVTGQLTDTQIAAVAAAKLTGTIVASQIADAAITIAKFGTNLKPIEIVSSLPASGNIEGRIVFLTTDDKLYRYTGSAWVATVPAGDITGTLADAQIAAVAAGKVTGQLTDSQIAGVAAAKLSGQVVATQIADLAITNAKLAALAVDAAKLASNAVTNTKIADDAISTPKLQANVIVADKIAAQAITASKLVLSDFSNLVPDEQMFDTGTWSGTHWTRYDVANVGGMPSKACFVHNSPANSTGYGGALVGGMFPVKQGAQYRASAFAYSNDSYRVWMRVHWYSESGGDLGYSTVYTSTSTVAGGNTVSGDVTITAPAGAVTANYKSYVERSFTTGPVYAGGFSVRERNAASLIVDGTIVTNLLAASAITTEKLAAGAVTADTIAANAITAAKISAGAIEAGKLAAGSVQAGNIAASAVTAGTIAANAVTAGTVAANAITAGTIAAGAIVADKIATNAITASKMSLASNSVGASLVLDRFYGDQGYWGQNLPYATLVTSADAQVAAMRVPGAMKFNVAQGAAAGGVRIHGWIARGIPVLPNTWYRASALVKNVGSNKGMNILTINDLSLAQTKGTQSVAANDATYTAASGGVLEYSFLTGTGQQTATIVPYVDTGTDGTGYYLISDYQLVEMSEASLIVDGAIIADKIAANAIVAGKIAANAVTAGTVAANAITAATIAAGAIEAGKLAANSVQAGNIAALAVTAGKIAANAVTAGTVAANAITAGTIAAGAVVADSIAANAITAKQLLLGDFSNMVTNDFTSGNLEGWALGPGGVYSRDTNDVGQPQGWDRLSSNARDQGYSPPVSVSPGEAYYGSAWVYNGAPETAHLLAVFTDANFGNPQYSFFASTTNKNSWTKIQGQFTVPNGASKVRMLLMVDKSANGGNGTLWAKPVLRRASSAELIVDGSITTGKLFADAVTTDKIAANAVTANEIAANAITAVKIAAGAIEAGKLAAGAVTAGTIAANAVTAGTIAALAVTSDKLSANSVIAGKIAAGVISATELAANSVTTAKIAANAVTANEIAANAITAGKIAADAVAANNIAANSITAKQLFIADFENFIPDGQFDQGTLTSLWDANYPLSNGPGSGGANIWLWNGDSQTGKWSLVLENGTNGGSGGTISMNMVTKDFIPVTAGDWLAWDVSVRTTDGSSGFGFYYRILWFDRNRAALTSPQYTDVQGNASIPAAWDKRSGKTQIPGAATYCKVQIYHHSPSTTRYLIIDRISLRKAEGAELVVDGSISTVHLAADSITSAKIAAGAVTAGEIAANAITAAKISGGAVEAGKLAAGAVVAGNIAANAVTAGTVAANAITAGTIAANAVTTGTIAAGAVTAGQIAAGAVIADKIAAGSIYADKLAVGKGTNWIPNSNAQADITNWRIYASSANWSFIKRNDNYTPIDGAFQVLQEGAQNNGQFADLSPRNPADNNIPMRWPVAQGSWMEASVYVYGHRSDYARLHIEYVNNGGVTIGYSFADKPTHQNGDPGSQLASYERIWVKGQAPAGTTHVQLFLRCMGHSAAWGTNSYTWASKFYLGEATANQLEASPWSEGGTTVISEGNIVTNAITANKIAASAITAGKIAANAVTAGTIAANAVTAGTIAANAVTAATIAAGAVSTNQLAANAITAAKIAGGTITGDKIAVRTISADSFLASTITGYEINARTIGAGHIAVGTISATEIASNAITADKISANAITAGKIGAGAVTAGTIAANAIVATNIQGGVITGDKLQANTLGAREIAAGSITAKQLVITDFNNLVPDNQMTTTDAWVGSGYIVWGDHGLFQSYNGMAFTAGPWGSGGYANCQSRSFPVKSGTQYRFTGAMYSNNNYDAFIRILWLAADGNILSLYDMFSGVRGAGHTGQLNFNITSPGGAASAIVELFVQRNNTGGNVYFGGVGVFERNAGDLIVDGTITANLINVNNLSALNIKVTNIDINDATLNGEKLVNGAISAVYYNTSGGTVPKSATTTVLTRTLTLAPEERLVINAFWNLRGAMTGVNAEVFYAGDVQLKINSTVLDTIKVTGPAIDTYGASNQSIAGSFTNGGSAQNVTITLVFIMGSGGAMRTNNKDMGYFGSSTGMTNDGTSWTVTRLKK